MGTTMSTPGIHFDINLIDAYETLRAQILSAGISSPLSCTDHRIVSEGLFQWALSKKLTQQKKPVTLDQALFIATPYTRSGDYLNVSVINLIASMAIQSINKNQGVA